MTEKHPQHVSCSSCHHVWVGLYLPMPMATAARVLKSLRCPMCGAPSSKLRMAEAPKAPA